MSSKPSCGIDFGTSNSTAAIAHNGKRQLIPLEQGKTTLPSAIFFKQGVGPLFGRNAMSAYLDGEDGRLMRGLKKILGTALMNERTQIGSRSVAFTDILRTFIGHIKEQADEYAGEPIEHLVLGRPVHFHDNDNSADERSQNTLEEIAKASGFKQIEFLYEPIAAAFAHEAQFEDERLSLVVDLGGGTSDFTVIKICSKNTQKADRRDDILATSGVRIGGTTFDYRLSMKSFMPCLGLGSEYADLFDKDKIMPVPMGVYTKLSDWALVHQAEGKHALSQTMDIKRRALDPQSIERLYKLQQQHLGHALLAEVETAKIALTETSEHRSILPDLDPDYEFQTTRAEFEACIHEDVERIFACITQCLNDARISAGDIDLVILTGGSTELPIVNSMVKAMFPKAAISQGNKMDSVGLGLAYRAANIF